MPPEKIIALTNEWRGIWGRWIGRINDYARDQFANDIIGPLTTVPFIGPNEDDAPIARKMKDIQPDERKQIAIAAIEEHIRSKTGNQAWTFASGPIVGQVDWKPLKISIMRALNIKESQLASLKATEWKAVIAALATEHKFTFGKGK